ncbi:Arm DNA-binding domain-containing protein [Burkholderia pyrrocinia]
MRQAKAGNKPTKLTDGNGLYLEVRPSGPKLWRYGYRIAGKENGFAIGEYPTVSLQTARVARDEARALVKKELHPSHARVRGDRASGRYRSCFRFTLIRSQAANGDRSAVKSRATAGTLSATPALQEQENHNCDSNADDAVSQNDRTLPSALRRNRSRCRRVAGSSGKHQVR